METGREGEEKVKLTTSKCCNQDTVWLIGRTGREWVGREVGGGIGMGKTCEPKAFSFQCMTKFTTNKKKKERNKKKKRPRLLLSVNFHGVNTPTITNFNVSA